jgi:hypothetical protein
MERLITLSNFDAWKGNVALWHLTFASLQINILRHVLENPRYGIQGLTFPSGKMFLNQSSANEIVMYLHGVALNLDHTIFFICLFCKTFNAKIN